MFIVDFFKSNPLALAILGGGTSTAIITYLLNTVKWIPNTIISTFMARITTRVQLTENIHFHSDTDVDKIRELESFIRTFKHRVIDNSLNLDSGGAYTKLPQGIYYIFKTVLTDFVIMTINVSSIENKGGGYKALIHRYDLHIIGTTKRRKRFINKLNDVFENKKTKSSDELVHNKIILACPDTNWNYLTTLNKRDLNTIYMDENLKNSIVTHIDNFLTNREVYDKYKITYKTGIVLYGEPGTGKTSLVRALVSHINGILINADSKTSTDKVQDLILNIRNNNCSNKTGISYEILDKTINIETAPIVILFEELDKFFLNSSDKRSKKETPKEDGNNAMVTVTSKEVKVPGEKSKEQSLTDSIANGMDNDILDDMLQFFDGMRSPENVIFIATTNYIERLDPALTRPGRFDLSVEMKRLTVEKACDMIENMIPGKSVMEYQEYIKEDGTVNSSELFTKLISDKIKEEVYNENKR